MSAHEGKGKSLWAEGACWAEPFLGLEILVWLKGVGQVIWKSLLWGTRVECGLVQGMGIWDTWVGLGSTYRWGFLVSKNDLGVGHQGSRVADGLGNKVYRRDTWGGDRGRWILGQV